MGNVWVFPFDILKHRILRAFGPGASGYFPAHIGPEIALRIEDGDGDVMFSCVGATYFDLAILLEEEIERREGQCP